jgi:hypothetical protein
MIIEASRQLDQATTLELRPVSALSISQALPGLLTAMATSKIPRTDELKFRRFEVGQVPRRQTPAVDARNGCNHSIGRGHGSAASERCGHDVAVGECRGFGEEKDAVGKTVALGVQALSPK